MNQAKVTDQDYVQFLLAAQSVYSCTEAATCQPDRPEPVAHDAFTRLLSRMPPDTTALWQEVDPLVNRHSGLLVIDDTTLDKPHAKDMELVTPHWSGKHHRVVLGINLITLLWTDGQTALPIDCAVYTGHLPDGHTKNDSFAQMLTRAKQRGFSPAMVCFDGWYSSLDNLKQVRGFGWHFLTRLKSNRQVDADASGNKAVITIEIGTAGRQVHLKGFGFITVFRTVAQDGDAAHWATSKLTMTEMERQELAQEVFAIENYHRGLKQCCGVEKCFARTTIRQTNHIVLSVRAFVRLEVNRIRHGLSWYQAKASLVRLAIADYLAKPFLVLETTAQLLKK